MSDEIKEIISYLKKKENTRNIKAITLNERDKLLDYITNLQQAFENSYTEEQLENYKSRCEKAIEYLKENVAVYAFNNKKLPHWEFNDDNINDLLNILQGGKDE